MSFFGKLFGTEKALTSVVDGVSKGLDALVYTDEEKADAAAKDRSEARAMVVQSTRRKQTSQSQQLTPCLRLGALLVPKSRAPGCMGWRALCRQVGAWCRKPSANKPEI